MEGPISSRCLVFISHANPEENDFVLWLGVQLASAGYEVWSDVTKLIGGEVFWDDIEDAIRHHSAKFIIVVSTAALKKDGVKDELNLGITVERKDKVPRFVVPIRVDDVAFSDFTANIARKNAIDFSKSWSDGLATLFEVLERDGVPRGAVKAADVKAWCESRFDPAKRPRNGDETLVSNWLPILDLPPELLLFSLGVEERLVRGLMETSKLPWFPYFRLVGTFATEADLRRELAPEQTIDREYTIPTTAFLGGKAAATPGVTRADARRFIVSLLRQAWNNFMERKGLLRFEMASGSIAWYFPKGLVEKDTTYFFDYAGKRRRKSVVGRSEKRGVYWHLGFISKPVLGDEPHFLLKAVVLFSEDGKKPLDSVDKMIRLRRGFCRNWWNPTWRDLMLGTLAWLSDGSGIMSIPFGDFAKASVSARPIEFTSPIACADPPVKTRAGEVTKSPPEGGQVEDEDEDEDLPPEATVEDDEDLVGSGLEAGDEFEDG
jgi:hypothetical protein